MADIDIFGDEPVVSMEEKEPEDKEELKHGRWDLCDWLTS